MKIIEIVITLLSTVASGWLSIHLYKTIPLRKKVTAYINNMNKKKKNPFVDKDAEIRKASLVLTRLANRALMRGDKINFLLILIERRNLA